MISLCSINTVVAFLLYVGNVVLLSKSKACLQKLLNILYQKFCISFSVGVGLYETKIMMIFGRNKKEIKARGILCRQIEITLGLISIHMVTLSHQLKSEKL